MMINKQPSNILRFSTPIKLFKILVLINYCVLIHDTVECQSKVVQDSEFTSGNDLVVDEHNWYLRYLQKHYQVYGRPRLVNVFVYLYYGDPEVMSPGVLLFIQ